MEQRTDEWFKERLGHVTASKIKDVLAKKGTATRGNYLMQLVSERLTGQREETFVSAAMKRGIEVEDKARMAYESIYGFVEKTGFHKHKKIKWFGASPDGLIGEDGVLQIKCPNTATHLEYIRTDKIPMQYMLQMTAQISCTGRKWAHFVSFDDRLPEGLQLFVKEYEPSWTDVNFVNRRVIEFVKDVEKELEECQSYMKSPQQVKNTPPKTEQKKPNGSESDLSSKPSQEK